MMKYFFCCLVLFSQIKISFSQTRQDTLLVVPAKNGLYFYHIVNKGETLYSLSREFQADVKKLAAFNKLTLQTPLKIYQLIKVPLNDKNLDQSVNVSSTSGLKPLYHKVIKGETLYHIGQLHDKVSTIALKKWNHLSGNEVKVGQYLVVGWLKKENNNLAAAQDNNSDSSLKNVQKDIAIENEPAAPVVAKSVASAESPEKPAPASNDAATASAGGNSFLNEVIAAENKDREKRATGNRMDKKITDRSKKKEPEPVKADEQTEKVAADDNDAFPVQAPAASPQSVKAGKISPDPVLVKKQAPKKSDSFALMLNQVTNGPKKKTTTPKSTSENLSGSKPEDSPGVSASAPVQAGGKADSSQLNLTVKSKFQSLYDRQTADNTNIGVKKGAAGWFRSNVKPGSGSYYALCDDLPRGTVVKVTNPINQKSVLVKVLDGIPKRKENYNLLIKLSDAAMGDLGVSHLRFWCEISYAKNAVEKK